MVAKKFVALIFLSSIVLSTVCMQLPHATKKQEELCAYNSKDLEVLSNKKSHEIVEVEKESFSFINVKQEKPDIITVDDLFLAASTNNIKLLKYYIKCWCDFEMQDKDGNTAIFLATRNGSLAAVNLLIKNGADVTHKNKDGQTAQEIAFFLKQASIFEILLNYQLTKQ